MNCIYKEYEVKNATVPMTTAKNEVVIGLLHENYYLVRGIDLWWEGITPIPPVWKNLWTHLKFN